MIAALILLLTFSILAVPVALVGIPWTLITGDVGRLYSWAMWIIRTGFRLAGIRVRVTGRELAPRGQACIFMSNHISNLDPPVLFPVLPGRTSVFLKRSLMKIPLLGIGMRLGKFIPVDRDGRLDSARESVRMAAEVLNSGVHITTFVEGTRSKDGRLLPFKKGPFFLAMETGAPVVPVTIQGTQGMMRKGSMKVIPGTARVMFHAPLWPRDFVNREALIAAVRESIASGLPEEMRDAPKHVANISTT